jgi:hypothetical protein
MNKNKIDYFKMAIASATQMIPLAMSMACSLHAYLPSHWLDLSYLISPPTCLPYLRTYFTLLEWSLKYLSKIIYSL